MCWIVNGAQSKKLFFEIRASVLRCVQDLVMYCSDLQVGRSKHITATECVVHNM